MHSDFVPVVAIIGLALVGGCQTDDAAAAEAEGASEPSWATITSPYAWVELEFADDPFADQRPADATCDPAGYGPDEFGGEPSFEIDTGLCGYLSISQAALQELPSGTPVELRLWHFELSAESEAEAYVALMLDGQLVVERSVPIGTASDPTPSELIVEEFELPVDVPLGAPVILHLHNHGSNTWNMISLQALLAAQ